MARTMIHVDGLVRSLMVMNWQQVLVFHDDDGDVQNQNNVERNFGNSLNTISKRIKVRAFLPPGGCFREYGEGACQFLWSYSMISIMTMMLAGSARGGCHGPCGFLDFVREKFVTPSEKG